MEVPDGIALTPTPCDGNFGDGGKTLEPDLEALVKSVTDAVMDTIGAK
jgi:hypothetical protein